MRDQIRRRRATGINELGDAGSGKALRIRTELTRRARRAVTRILEVADEVVMLERRCDEKDCIEREADGGKPPASLPCANCHLSMLRLPANGHNSWWNRPGVSARCTTPACFCAFDCHKPNHRSFSLPPTAC